VPVFDVIVVGSGPAGVFAARELTPLNVLMLDVGYEAGGERLPAENLHVLRTRERDLSAALLGEHFESLHNVDRSYLSPKLKAPLMRFITEMPPGERDVITHGFAAVRSYAKGGLANAWGAGVFRYDEHDLAGYPVSAAELDPFYDDITKHVGISGAADDLAKYFGSTEHLQPTLPLGRVATRLLRRYQRRRARFNARGISLGHLRSAILTQPHRGREAHTVRNQEFYQPNIPSVYHPGYTLDEMRAAKQLTYVAGVLVQRYEEHDDHVDVFARDVRTGETVNFSARHLVLAAGALNSAAIVLAAHDDHDTRLPILDNLLSYVPLLDVGAIGFAYDAASFSGAELCLVYDGPLAGQRVQGSFYGLTAPLKGDLFFEMPLSARGNFAAMKYVLPAIGMLQMFYPDRPDPANHVRLGPDGALQIQYSRREFGGLERHLIAQFLRAGYLSAPALCQYPEPGSSMHYAGTLPMKASPSSRYESDRFGQLNGSRRVRVADGAALPMLPSKNHTFTIMANAARVARHLRENLV
jgi:choline dehydrogenase-like flavoprotein